MASTVAFSLIIIIIKQIIIILIIITIIIISNNYGDILMDNVHIYTYVTNIFLNIYTQLLVVLLKLISFSKKCRA